MKYFIQEKYLVFDPTVSSHYEVFSIPRVPYKEYPDDDPGGIKIYGRHAEERIGRALLRSSWPLSPCVLNVFSSRTGSWHKRFFDRDGEAAGSVADMQLDERYWMRRRNSVYCHGALYVHCENDYIMRISLSANKYRMVKPPRVTCDNLEFNLGKSGKDVYYALLDDDDLLRVWILAEPSACGELEWILKHDSGCSLFLPSLNCVPKAQGPWNLHDVTSGKGGESGAVQKEHKYEWNSDDESILHNEDSGPSRCCDGYLDILGFHPYKEIIFMHWSTRRVLAYHLNSSKLEDLGHLRPNNMTVDDIGTTFPFTPCLIAGELSEQNNN
ncbi:hypothetical protein HU200_021953 [Digitaria exilis]|uniref:F-box associated domain-containing protein n=1 Tax=Digitaria exilis TaxID=1010633 RepID=A0A835C1U1_9POAL|nr:hypothetical protein HU200_021953 [Digitaria exilis]